MPYLCVHRYGEKTKIKQADQSLPVLFFIKLPYRYDPELVPDDLSQACPFA